MTAHTPGPWVPRATKLGLDFGIVVQGKFVIAEVFSDIRQPEHKDIEEARANARLIAAAPDMLAALEKVWSEGVIPDGFALLQDQVSDAIAKATPAASIGQQAPDGEVR